MFVPLLDFLQLKHYVYLLVAVCLATAYYNKSKKTAKPTRVSSANKDRKFGTWVPDDFVTPVPLPFKNWDVNKTQPLPYRAFKHKYNVTMGIRNMEWDSWIELDNEWMKYHSEKIKRLDEKGTEVYGTLPGAEAAVLELLDEFWAYLPARYPSLFRQLDNGLENLLTGERFVFKNCTEYSEDPMVMAAKMVQDDLAIMIEGSDGNYVLKAGAIILPGFWRFKDKVGLPLNQIHTNGDVPKYQEKLQSGMTKFFTRLTCEKPVVRNNYFIQTDNALGWSTSIGDENSDVVGWYTAKPAETPDQIWYRSERQSLRRLPKTGAVVFTIRTYFCPMTEMCTEPYIPRRLLNGIESWTDDVREYRGYEKFKDVLLPYLEEKAQEQEKRGYVVENEPLVYPF
ncbi:hypothetical protein METBIDRAFT_77460 [Metschnikowia bicuspidata var. bicuspidata NRRL YB-4993]|uniref:HRQ family protein n=1 Tax=Metschnikowia bicuspidata var. bicuspidata NRRL YB-4993 TaxID=869754 RepID=A0A1A0HDB1_9ASCO|nr:hypothetical protein METBIDRAFT_77460 [Metschnikowia bicuspidata var. bicuspidata NRRL YB-4993]OBA21918.1 hypothetical protein METBIDRAFT_77460 [Metschnikowia bicuspidata var. bicuspidata NRRL YB-4993]